ncbi:MFS transporter [Arthrobacter sp. H41]|uniref:MFS transporter n=1 Tax=Arthrobacter sp. H41 TaxID=1312978 RepID=UPI0004AE3EC5|nr:MFS transporter [Arthrobacter sp. H41]
MRAVDGVTSTPMTPQRSWWGVVIAGALISAATAPGQTAGLSPLTDPLIEQLDISRTDISFSYLIGTLAGAVALPFIGRGLDRWGARKVILIAVLAFSLALMALSFVSDIYGLTAGFVILRMAGQGTLTLAATTAVVKAIHHRRGLAVGLVSAVGSAGISLTPLLVERLVSTGGISLAWRIQSLAVLVIVLPMILFLPRHESRPHTVLPQARTTTAETASPGWSTRDAARTPIFWTIAAALAATGMLSTALAFHQISILTTQGLTTTEAAANFIPQTITAILATLLVGGVAHTLEPRLALAGSMALLAGALCFLPFITGLGLAVAYGLILGAASGSIRAIEPIALAHYFGTENIGGIRGIITSINVGSTALGPILFSLGRDLTGSYAIPSLIAATIPLTVGALALFSPLPHRTTEQ